MMLDKKIVELDTKIKAAEKLAEEYEKSKADDILIYGSKLQVSSGGTPIGTGVQLPLET